MSKVLLGVKAFFQSLHRMVGSRFPFSCVNPWNVKAATKVIYPRKASGTNGHLGHNQWPIGSKYL